MSDKKIPFQQEFETENGKFVVFHNGDGAGVQLFSPDGEDFVTAKISPKGKVTVSTSRIFPKNKLKRVLESLGKLDDYDKVVLQAAMNEFMEGEVRDKTDLLPGPTGNMC